MSQRREQVRQFARRRFSVGIVAAVFASLGVLTVSGTGAANPAPRPVAPDTVRPTRLVLPKTPPLVVELNRALSALRHNVLSHGQLILSRDDAARRSFYVRHAQEWYDMEPIRRLFAEAMLRRIKEGTFGGGKGNGSQAA